MIHFMLWVSLEIVFVPVQIDLYLDGSDCHSEHLHEQVQLVIRGESLLFTFDALYPLIQRL